MSNKPRYVQPRSIIPPSADTLVQQQARLRQAEQQRMLQGAQMGMPGNMADMQHMMRYQNSMQQQENLRRNALQNNRAGGMQP